MRSRRFVGVLLFALGFGSAFLMRLPSTQAASRERVIQGNLKYIVGDRGDFQLIYPKPNKNDVFVVVGRNLGKASQRRVSWHRGKLSFTKEQRTSLTIFSLTPVMKVTAQFENPCGPPVLCPFPDEPPRGPIPPRPTLSEEQLALDKSDLAFLGPDLGPERPPRF